MSNSYSNGDDLLAFIASTIESMRDQMATKSDLEGMATKSDLAQLEERLSHRLDVQITSVRGDIEQIHLRLMPSSVRSPRGSVRSRQR